MLTGKETKVKFNAIAWHSPKTDQYEASDWIMFFDEDRPEKGQRIGLFSGDELQDQTLVSTKIDTEFFKGQNKRGQVFTLYLDAKPDEYTSSDGRDRFDTASANIAGIEKS